LSTSLNDTAIKTHNSFSYIFIPNIYMFRALVCSSSGELIVLVRYLVYVILSMWPSGMQVWIPPKPAYQTVTYV